MGIHMDRDIHLQSQVPAVVAQVDGLQEQKTTLGSIPVH